ncbi:MAG: hypothetical protein ABEJ87_04360 [Candidatus Nanohalobium sp.]
MKAEVIKLSAERRKSRKEWKTLEKNPHLVGNCSDSRETRNRWIDAVEEMLDQDAFESGEVNSRKKFDEVMKDGDYGLNEPEKWMLTGGREQ